MSLSMFSKDIRINTPFVSEAMDTVTEADLAIAITREDVLRGIVTNRDLRFENNFAKKISPVMTTNLITTDHQTNLEVAARILQKHKIEKLPIVDNSGKLVGLITYEGADAVKVGN